MLNPLQINTNPVFSKIEKNIEYSPNQFVEDAFKLIGQSKEKKIAVSESIKSFFIDHESDFKREEFIKNVVSIALLRINEESTFLLSEIILDEFKNGKKSLLSDIVQHISYELSYAYFEDVVSYIQENYNIQDEVIKQSIRIEAVKCLVDMDPRKVSKNIQNYGIDTNTKEGQRGLIEIAKKIAENEGSIVCPRIHFFGIDHNTKEGQLALIEIAKIASKDAEFVANYFENFKIDGKTEEGQKAIIELVKMIASRDGEVAAKWFKKFGIEDQNAIVEIAMLATERYLISEYINNFGIDKKTIEGQKALIAIAKREATSGRYKTEVYKYIQDYGIDGNTEEGLKALIEIAKLSAGQCGTPTLQHIKNFGINAQTKEGKQGLIDIAKIAIKEDGGSVQYIKNCGIDSHTEEGQKLLIEIAKQAASQNGLSTAKFFKYYEIDANSKNGNQVVIEIAEKAVTQNGAASEFIQNFGINAETKEGQQILIQLAKKAAAQNGNMTAKFIKNYGIDGNTEEGKQALIDIAKIAILNNGKSAEYIENFGIDGTTKEGKQTLIEIAEIGVEGDGLASLFIKRFGIDGKTKEGQQILIQLAKKAAAKNGGRLSEFIAEYEIESQEALIEIALVSADQDGNGTSKWFKNYRIDGKTREGQHALIKIAKKSAATGLSSLYIQNFEIEFLTEAGQKALIEIALISAAHHADSYFFKRYRINSKTEEGQQGVIKIAMVAAAHDGGETSACILKYGINDKSVEGQQALFEIAKIAIIQNSLEASEHFKNYNIEDESLRLKLFLIAFSLDRESSKHISNYALSDFILEWNHNTPIKMSEKLFGIDSTQQKLIKTLHNDIENQSEVYVRSELFCWLKFVIGSLYQLGVKTITEQQSEILREIIKYRDPAMRYQLTSALLEHNENQMKAFKFLVKDKKNDYILLPSIFLSYFMNDEKNWFKTIEKLHNRNLFKDNNAHRVLINTLYQFKKTTELSNDDICYLLERAVDPKDRDKTISNLKMIQGIIALKCANELKKESIENCKDISILYQTLFKQLIPIKEIENFQKKFQDTFFDPRINASLLIYAGKMKHNNETMKAFVSYVENVLEGTFLEKRYQLDNIHLKTIFKDRETLLKEWIQGDKQELYIDSNSTKPLSRDYDKIFYDKIVQDKHLDPKKFSIIKDYLLAKQEDRKKIEEILEEQIRNPEKKEKDLLIEKKDKLNSLQLQRELIGLIKGQKEEDQLKTLQRIKDIVPKNSEFNNDIKSLINSFNIKERSELFHLVDTDNYKDLLMCGTEVGGSCQRVDGDSQNRGLLAYLLDGKIRLLAIKNSEGKIVARRILRILWDNKNQKPALMMERTYPAVVLPAHNEAIMNFAKKRADKLGLSLYESNGIGSADLESFGSPVSWEYVDSASGMSNGKYKITKATVVSESIKS